jgi:hypothetical protein
MLADWPSPKGSQGKWRPGEVRVAPGRGAGRPVPVRHDWDRDAGEGT